MIFLIEEIINACKKLMVINNSNIAVLDAETMETTTFSHFSTPKFVEERINKNTLKIFDKYSDSKNNNVVIFHDELKMAYLIILLSEEKCIVSMGPFLNEKIKKDEIKYLGHSMHLSIDNLAIFENYYSKLPLYNNDEISNISFIYYNFLSSKYVEPSIIYDTKRSRLPQKNQYSNKFEQYDFVEQNYKRENELLKAIETGNVDGVKDLTNLSYEQINIPSRNKYDPIRDAKNLTITLNSVAARAAIRGGLNVHLAHSISTKYAIAIEAQKKVDGVLYLAGELAKEYASSVREYSLSKYSPLVKSALVIIRKNITQPINLHEIAENLNISKEHLSRVFKKELGKTVTDYINEIKIKESLYLISSKKYSISEIAFMFGFSNSAYYSTVFKKVLGCSPRDYKQQN